MPKHLIISADDFGLDVSVNEAVEIACRDGVLTSASLMMGETATADAIMRAKSLPRLRVGLHLTLTDGHPVLPPETIPDLVDAKGAFRRNMVLAGFRFFCLPHVRRQLAQEIRAQFAAFAATGLTLDHVNAHKHFHLHPTVAGLMLSIGKEYGLKAVRLPFEPGAPLDAAEARQGTGGFAAIATRLWTRLLRRQIHEAGLVSNDQVFGIAWSGAMTASRLVAIVQHLPEGVSEIYCHPATTRTPALVKAMPDYRHVDEFRALINPTLKQCLEDMRIIRTSFTDLLAPGIGVAA